jgi:hypothetical protein
MASSPISCSGFSKTMPFIPEVLIKNILLLYGSLLGRFTAEMVYVDPLENISRKAITQLRGNSLTH